MTLKRTAAAILAAATAAASVSVCAYAESKVELVDEAPFVRTYENVASAEGYDDEARAVLNYYGIDPNTAELSDAFEGVLAGDSTITLDFEDDTVKENALPSFSFFKFSEDGTTLVPQYLVYTHPHPATVDYVWEFDRVKVIDEVKGEPYTADGQIDGIDYNTSRCIEGYTTVLGNKISGNLIKKLYEEGVAGAKNLGSDFYTDEQLETINSLPTYDGCDVVSFAITIGDVWYGGLFLTESYVNDHPLTPDAPTDTDTPDSEIQVGDTEPAPGDCTGDVDDSGDTSDDDGSGNNPGTGVAVAVAPAILAAGALAAAAVIRKRK